VVGVSDPAVLELIAEALGELRHERALVVHGAPGLDELSPLGPTEILELRDGETRRWSFDPRAELGWPAFAAEELAGGGPAENVAVVLGVLKGERKGAARAAVLLNAGAALYVAGKADSLPEGISRAEAALDAGAGTRALERLRAASRRR
jgi:anthranilate phosphoribosyltransferase